MSTTPMSPEDRLIGKLQLQFLAEYDVKIGDDVMSALIALIDLANGFYDPNYRENYVPIDQKSYDDAKSRYQRDADRYMEQVEL